MKKTTLKITLSLLLGASSLMASTTLSAQSSKPAVVATDSISFQPDEEIAVFDLNLNNLYSLQALATGNNPGDCKGSDVNPTFTEEEYKKRLAQLPNLIEMPYNSIVQTYIDFYMVRRRKQVGQMIGLGCYYFPIFEKELEANDMPLELKYLPVIESALNPNAFSKAGASGLWQFMLATGKAYGLNVNNLVDERRDPIKATKAGVRYLKDLYNIYNDWHLAIAAYNCGPGNVNKAIRRAGGKKDYWAIYYFLPKETRGYVPAFIAANYVMHYYPEHKICPVDYTNAPLLTDTIMVTDRLHLQQVATVLNIPIEELRYMNPQYRRDIIPGNICEYALCLPHNQTSSFIERRDSIFAYKADELVNNMRTEVSPSAGATGYYGSKSSTSSQSTGSGNKTYYKVKSGDYLSKIAQRYGVSVASIKQWNNLKSNNLKVGQNLIIYTKKTMNTSSLLPIQPNDSPADDDLTKLTLCDRENA
jgi:membrane-bound lytic murein transglycosylase D